MTDSQYAEYSRTMVTCFGSCIGLAAMTNAALGDGWWVLLAGAIGLVLGYLLRRHNRRNELDTEVKLSEE